MEKIHSCVKLLKSTVFVRVSMAHYLHKCAMICKCLEAPYIFSSNVRLRH